MDKRLARVEQLPAPVDRIERTIYLIRGQKVMLDRDLAELYEVPTKALNQAVSRNADRFPDDFMFRLNATEAEALNRSQIVTGSHKHRDPRLLPYAFTEHGVAMLSSVLRSKRAVQMNIVIIRAFMKLRQILASHTALARRIERVEATQKDHGAILSIVAGDVETLAKKVAKEFRKLKAPPRRHTPQIGFRPTAGK
jgi:hypothetical protein